MRKNELKVADTTAAEKSQKGAAYGFEFWIPVVLLIVVTASVYSPVVTQQFSHWDDPKHIKAIWKPGWERAWSIVTDFRLEYTGVAYYTPIHFLSLMAEQAAAGSDLAPQAWVSKLMNVVYHIAITLLLFALLRTTGIERRSAFIAALVFAIHPVQVGTVAWVAERKNLLAALFYLSAMLTYLSYAKTGRKASFVLVLLFFTMGLMSKPAVVTLPVALAAWLLLVPDRTRRESGGYVLIGIMCVLAFAWGLYTISTEVSYSGMLPTWPYRPLVAAGAIWFYLGKFVFPYELVVVYPKWDVVGQWGRFLLPFLALAVAAVLGVKYRKRLDPVLLWGLSLFVINVLPVAGFVSFGHLGHSYVADHFLYLPMMGLALVVGRGLEVLFREIRDRPTARSGLITACYAVVCILGILSVRQTWLWSDPAIQWEATLKVNKTSPAVYNNYGWVLMERGQLDRALALFEKAAELAPRMEAPYQNMGRIYYKMGDKSSAAEMFKKARRMGSRSSYPRIMIGYILREEGKHDDAVDYFTKEVNADPSSALLRTELALSYHSAGRVDEALAELDRAMAVGPLEPSSYVHKAMILSDQGNLAEAEALLKRSLALEPAAEAYNMLGTVYARQGKMSHAYEEFRRAYALRPELVGIRDNVARSLMEMNQTSRAGEFCEREARAGRPCSRRILEQLLRK
ncbi:MAG: tetratricopeptide repeat protein [Desulfomonilaceae bacterium]|nr:tetratricopeptide repeat protein [Desulfomonilaceae bacterium]